jgi:putative colanic acid biosynthesis acetyltransferase WcaF
MINVKKNRSEKKYTLSQYLNRLAWDYFGVLLFKIFPTPYFWWYRNIILNLFGAKIGKHVRFCRSVSITCPYNLEVNDGAAIDHNVTLYCLAPVKLGSRCVISQKTFLCAGTHDYHDEAMPLKKLPIKVGNDTWVCASAFIGPGVEIESDCVIGAGSVVISNVARNSVVAGNPATFKKKKYELLK